MPKSYGQELILDLHNCSTDKFNEEDLREFVSLLCAVIDMEPVELHVWTDENLPDELHLKGTSLVQFIKTSDIVIHTLDRLEAVYLNIFTCKDFDPKAAERFCAEYFNGEVVQSTFINRGEGVYEGKE